MDEEHAELLARLDRLKQQLAEEAAAARGSAGAAAVTEQALRSAQQEWHAVSSVSDLGFPSICAWKSQGQA